MNETKVTTITKKNVTVWGTVKFLLFWICMVALWFKISIISILLSALMLSTIRIRKNGDETYELEYGLISLLRRWSDGKANN